MNQNEKALTALKKAQLEVERLCSGERWRMSIPANEKHDSDIIISTALTMAQSLLESQSAPVGGEAVNEWDEISKEDMWDEIQAIRELTNNDGTMSPRQSVANIVDELNALITHPQAVEVVSVPTVERRKMLESLLKSVRDGHATHDTDLCWTCQLISRIDDISSGKFITLNGRKIPFHGGRSIALFLNKEEKGQQIFLVGPFGKPDEGVLGGRLVKDGEEYYTAPSAMFSGVLP